MMDLLLIPLCSVPHVHPRTNEAIIRQESGFEELAINLNRPRDLTVEKERDYARLLARLKKRDRRNQREAVSLARDMIAKGFTVDLGLMQINSLNLEAHGVTVQEMFDPCKNISVGTRILKTFYEAAEKDLGPGQDALRAALSAYNTGNRSSGLRNGYVDRFYKKKGSTEDPHHADIMADSSLDKAGQRSPFKGSLQGDRRESHPDF